MTFLLDLFLLQAISTNEIDWIEQPIDVKENHHDAKGYIGVHPSWRFVLVSFDVSYQGFPEGTRGYDGTATSMEEPSIIRLNRLQAEMLCKDAEERLKNQKNEE